MTGPEDEFQNVPDIVPVVDQQDADLVFVPDSVRPEDFEGEGFTTEQLKFLAGVALPVLTTVNDGKGRAWVIVTAENIAQTLEKDGRLSAKFSASFWRGVAYEDRRKRQGVFDPALGDVGRVVDFPIRIGRLIRSATE